MRVWIDMTASAHVLVFRPLIQILRGRCDDVVVTRLSGPPVLLPERPVAG